MNRNLIINIYNMSNIVEPGRKKNFCFSFLTFFRRRSKVAPYDPVDCSICFFPIGATRNYYYKCQHGEFCKLCLEKWRDKHNNCPICRADSKKKYKKSLRKNSRRRRRQLLRLQVELHSS
jgi:hypothetical protein